MKFATDAQAEQAKSQAAEETARIAQARAQQGSIRLAQVLYGVDSAWILHVIKHCGLVAPVMPPVFLMQDSTITCTCTHQ